MRIKIIKCRGTKRTRLIRLGTSIIADLGLIRCPESLSQTNVFVRRVLKRYNKFSEKNLKDILERCNKLEILDQHCFLVLNISDRIVQKHIKLREIESYVASYRESSWKCLLELIRPSINPDDSLDDFEDDLYFELCEKGIDTSSEDLEFIGDIKLEDILKCFTDSKGLISSFKGENSTYDDMGAWILKVLNSPPK